AVPPLRHDANWSSSSRRCEMKSRLVFVMGILLSSVLGGGPLAQTSTPQTIKVQGYLSQNSGGTVTPVTGNVALILALFDADVGGTLVASVGPVSVSVTNGLYEVDVPFASTNFNGPDRYIEVSVNGQTLAPRMKLASAPFAFTAETLDGLDASAFAKAGDVSA